MIDTSLAADAGIDLRQKRRWNLDNGNSTHVNRGNEARNVADNASAKGNHGGLPRQV